MARDDLHFRLRIPEGLKKQVEDAADKNQRSMTAEIIDRLEWSFERADIERKTLLAQIEEKQIEIRKLTEANIEKDKIASRTKNVLEITKAFYKENENWIKEIKDNYRILLANAISTIRQQATDISIIADMLINREGKPSAETIDFVRGIRDRSKEMREWYSEQEREAKLNDGIELKED